MGRRCKKQIAHDHTANDPYKYCPTRCLPSSHTAPDTLSSPNPTTLINIIQLQKSHWGKTGGKLIAKWVMRRRVCAYVTPLVNMTYRAAVDRQERTARLAWQLLRQICVSLSRLSAGRNSDVRVIFTASDMIILNLKKLRRKTQKICG